MKNEYKLNVSISLPMNLEEMKILRNELIKNFDSERN